MDLEGILRTGIYMKKEQEPFQFSLGVLIYPILFVLVIWTVLSIEVNFGMNFTTWGVRPRTGLGLRGILFSPFIHSGITHLWHNTGPLLVLSMALFYFYRPIAWKVLLLILLLSGFGTWIMGRPSYHIGMSGVIYGLVSFLFFKGVIAKHKRLIALSLVVIFLYGSLIWGTMPMKDGVSWEGHLAGFIAGALLALRFRESIPKPQKYVWESPEYKEEDDPFMKHFDADGNFIETQPEEELLEEIPNELPQIKVHYEFRPKNASKKEDNL